MNERNYVLFPFSFEICMTMRKSDQFNLKEFAKNTFDISMRNPLILSICKEQIDTILAFGNTIGDLMKLHTNQHIRPSMDIKIGKEYSHTTKRWWKYAISAVIEEKKSKLDFMSAFKKYARYKRYISYYKRQKKFVSPKKIKQNSNLQF
jgi:Vacuolar sorting-associated protein 13, N-terminal